MTDAPALLPDLYAKRGVTERQAATFCGLSVATMRRVRQAGTGPAPVMLGARRVGYRVDALDAWLAGRSSVSKAA